MAETTENVCSDVDSMASLIDEYKQKIAEEIDKERS